MRRSSSAAAPRESAGESAKGGKTRGAGALRGQAQQMRSRSFGVDPQVKFNLSVLGCKVYLHRLPERGVTCLGRIEI